MPPVRKKGGTINNNNNNTTNNNRSKVKIVTELGLGDLVLAKVKGFPAWPAKVSRPEDWERKSDPKKSFVQFFGTQEIAFVAPVDIQPFSSELKTKLLSKCKGKTVKYFAQAVKEIFEAFEELQRKRDTGGDFKNDLANINGEKNNGSHVHSTKVLKSGESLPSNSVPDCTYLSYDSAMGDKLTGAMKDSSAYGHEKIKMEKNTGSSSPGHAQGSLTAPSLFSPGVEGKINVESNIISARRGHIESSTALRSSPHCSDTDVDRISSYHCTGSKNTSMSPGASGHLKFSGGEDKKSSVKDKSKDVKVGAKRKIEGVTFHADDEKSVENLRKASDGGLAKRLASNSNKFELNNKGKTSKNLFKGPKQSDIIKSSPHNLPTKFEGHLNGGHPRQKNDQAGNDPLLVGKKTKVVDSMTDAAKGSVLKNGNYDLETEMPDEEAVPPVAKHRSHALDTVSNEGKGRVKNDVPKKRRAVRLCNDDSDDEPKTPVHGSSMKSGVKVSSSVIISDSAKKTNEQINSSNCAGQYLKVNSQDIGSPQKNIDPSAKPIGDSSRDAILLQKADRSTKANMSHSPGLDKQVIKENKIDLISPTKSPQAVPAIKKSTDRQWSSRPFNRVTDSVPYSKAQIMPGKDRTFTSGGSNSSQSLNSAKKSRQLISEEEVKIPPKKPATSRDDHKDHELDRRLEDSRDKSCSLVESKASNDSMKNLIAQAKMRQAHKQNVPTSGGDSVVVPSATLLGRNPSPFSSSPAFVSDEVNATQPGSEGVEAHRPFASPSSCAPRSGHEHPEEKGLSLGLQSAGSTLSGGTEAAVVRDAFEGMIETLSRTKESIGRATRLAIDCAKYGIANEVVDLLIRKLENESSFHRRVDLFFLVDSITQCSHSQKGVAGASYLPTVQAALPRLLGAAAPPGPNARENRRQCLKVLRLWLERKILPESVLRRFMDDIGGSNDGTSGVSFKRISKVHRSVDDPIREMEGMLVDEYGSNATFNLPGFLSSHGFADDEEDEDDGPSTPHNKSEASPLQPCTNASIEQETGRVTPNDKCHHILEHVDGELEMEDVSGRPKDENLPCYDLSKNDEQDMQLDTEVDISTDNIVEPPSLDGSPPMPLESPPPLPPLPSSPPPPPPPPLSPSPPPPPPPHPPSTLLSQLPLPSLHPTGPSQADNFQHLIPLQLSATPQAVLHPPAAIPSVQGGHAVQMTGNISQQVPRFMPAGVSISRPLEYGQIDLYAGPQVGPANQQFQQHQQFQPSPATFSQRGFPPAPSPQPPLGPFVHNKPPPQQHIPHSHSHLPAFLPPPSHQYSSSNLEGLRRFTDEQWRSAHVDYNADKHYNAWNNGGRAQSTTTFSEAYVRLPQRASTDNLGHHASVPNSSMGTPSATGHGISQMLPFRPDTSSVNCWRPV